MQLEMGLSDVPMTACSLGYWMMRRLSSIRHTGEIGRRLCDNTMSCAAGRLWWRRAASGTPRQISQISCWSIIHVSAGFLLRDYDRWLAGRSQLVQPGVPLWAAVSVQFGEQVGQQSDALAETLSAPPDVDSHRLETLVQLACVRGFRGIVVRTSSPLDEGTPQARHRAAVLELLNRRLQLLEPWIASGKVVGQIESTDSPWTGIVLLVDRARLLVPIAAECLGWRPDTQ